MIAFMTLCMVVCRGHAGECPDGERSSKEESRMKLTLEEAKAMMGQNNGNLYLSGTEMKNSRSFFEGANE